MPIDPGSPVYFVLHLPKTAGSTIEVHLEEHCPTGVLWRPQPAQRLEILTGRRYDLRRLPDMSRVQAVVGHHVGRSLEQYFPGREIRRVVLLRDPLSLQVSYYNYMNMWYLDEGLGTYSFGLHLKSFQRNFIAQRLLSRWLEIPWPVIKGMSEQRKYALLNEMLSRFWFVGAHTDCDRLIAAIAPDFDVPPVAWRRNTADEWHKRVEWQPVNADDLSVASRETILTNNRIDQALWESWRTAGFNTAEVRPRSFERTWGARIRAHDVTRLFFEGIRLMRRGWSPRIQTMRAHLKSIAKMKPGLEWDGVNGGPDLLVALDADPDNPQIWRAILTRCRQTRIVPSIPERLVGCSDQIKDPELSIVKGDVLRLCGFSDAARRFLRHAPTLSKTLRQLRDTTERAAARDADFQELISRADQARDNRDWREGEKLYRRALILYPGHFGYLVQYAHCLKEQGNFAPAEIYYRLAIALGVPLRDVREHLDFSASRQGYHQTSDRVAYNAAMIEADTSVDHPAVKANLDFVRTLCRQSNLHDDTNILHTLRMHKTLAEIPASATGQYGEWDRRSLLLACPDS